MTIDTLQGFHAHGEEARCLPEIRTALHDPSCCRVPERVRRHTFETSSLTCGGKTFLDVADARTVVMQYITKIASAFAGAFQMRQKS